MIQEISLVVCIVLTLLNIVDRALTFKDRAKAPYIQHDERLTALEVEVSNINKIIASDGSRIADLEQGTKVLIKSMGALLSHGIDGNNIDEMKMAREELNNYLLSQLSDE